MNLLVQLHAGEPTVGIWCGRCLTSAGFKVNIYAFPDTDGPHLLGVYDGCLTCDG